MEEHILTREIDNPYVDTFLSGYYRTATLFSAIKQWNFSENSRDKYYFLDNPMRLRMVVLNSRIDQKYNEKLDPLLFGSYFIGCASGFSALPLDFCLTVWNNIKNETIRDKEKAEAKRRLKRIKRIRRN